ncbi:MAG: HEAT repeat domain-containing protein [Planctomycetota bacterium]|jgi:hypothetical protein
MPTTKEPTKPEKTINELVKQLGSDNQQDAFIAYQELLQKILQTTSYRSRRKRLHVPMAVELVTELEAMAKPAQEKKKKKPQSPKPVHSVQVRNKILRLLSFVAGPGQMPAVGRALKDLQTRDMALYLLVRNSSPNATDLLIGALDQVGPNFRVAVVNALAKREVSNVWATLKKVADQDQDSQVRIAAIEALAKFAEITGDTTIAQATKDDSKCIRERAHKTRVRLAETLLNAGKRDDAARVYKAVLSSDAGKPQKKAAKMGLEVLK